MKALMWAAGGVLAVVLLATGFLYSGLYPMGADDRHTPLVYWALETLRERSIARASRDLEVPNLDEPSLLLAGGADYNDMCSGCHLKPGMTESDMSIGLYPQPPNLSQTAAAHGHHHEQETRSHADAAAQSARRQFWIIKHGIKASGMPAWGATHDDARVWAMVAFLQKMAMLTPEQYQILTARGDDAGGPDVDHDDVDGELPMPAHEADHSADPHDDHPR